MKLTSVVLAALGILWPLTAASEESQRAFTETEVTIGEGDGRLFGTMLIPVGEALDMVVIEPGSGPTDRNGNQAGMKNDSLKMIAEALGDAGIATIRIDKRGIAKSAKAMTREDDITLDIIVEDFKNWAAFAKSQPGVKRVFLLGHSEGALVAAIAGQSPDIAGVISVSGAGIRASDILRRQIAAANPVALPLIDPILKKLEAGELVPDVMPALATLFRPSVQPYLISWFKYDPAVEIAKVPGKVAILQGTTDIQVLVEDAEKLHAAKPDAAYTIIEGMNHVLKIAPADGTENAKAYNDPSLPLAAGFMDAILGFIKGA